MSESNKSEKFKKAKFIYKVIYTYILRILFMPVFLFFRLLNDERLRLYYNKLISLSQNQGMNKQRFKIIIGSGVILLIQVISFSILMLGSIVNEDLYGVYDGFIEFLDSYNIEIFKDIFSGYLSYLFLLTFLAGNILNFCIFIWSGSRYKKLFKALKDNGIEGKDGTKPTWYYPGGMLFIDLVGRTGEDLVKNNQALWNQAAFEPTQDVKKIQGTNQWIITAAVQKKSNSTMLYDRYEEWTTLQTDKMKNYNWCMGEYVNRNEVLWKDAFEDFSLAFIGMSGSGKTEAMKMWLTSFLCKHPSTHLVICDLKMTGDWDVFASMTETGKIIKTVEETLLAISYYDDLLNSRTDYMAKKSYKNIRTWSEAENTFVPPVLLIIDEFPQLSGPLKWDMQSRRDGTPANTLFKLYTKGRSFGLWVILGSQFGGGDAIPSEINKNCKVHVMLRTGSEGESLQWINSGKAFFLGKTGLLKEDGSEDKQIGYAYVDNEVNFVRFWYIDDWLIVHEFLKYGVKTINGMPHFAARKMGIPMGLRDKLKQVGGDKKKLNRYDQKLIDDNEKAQALFEDSYKKLHANPHAGLKEPKKPIGMLWKQNETVEDYFKRTREIRGRINSGEVIDIEALNVFDENKSQTDNKTTESVDNRGTVEIKKEVKREQPKNASDDDLLAELNDLLSDKPNKEEKKVDSKEKKKEDDDFDKLFAEFFGGEEKKDEKKEKTKVDKKEEIEDLFEDLFSDTEPNKKNNIIEKTLNLDAKKQEVEANDKATIKKYNEESLKQIDEEIDRIVKNKKKKIEKMNSDYLIRKK